MTRSVVDGVADELNKLAAHDVEWWNRDGKNNEELAIISYDAAGVSGYGKPRLMTPNRNHRGIQTHSSLRYWVLRYLILCSDDGNA